ncbi:MAG: hypothetical protein KJ893_00420 [Candidatus Omnitrophica bacterium]|nr:hypothetical protein [Candidatus Omnitrophota bacterium]MBU4479339.1 hypothetical protein [Candidatus Omnitrophota bacterium]MCG2704223.1 hypothetical protein [Candidatus Omnitrophota bacterium]
MKKDRFKTIFFITLIALNMAVRVFCYPADVHDLSGPKYFPAVKEAIADAQESIKVVMFIIELAQEKNNSKVQQWAKPRIAGKSSMF